jgi:hypothetical protein
LQCVNDEGPWTQDACGFLCAHDRELSGSQAVLNISQGALNEAGPVCPLTLHHLPEDLHTAGIPQLHSAFAAVKLTSGPSSSAALSSGIASGEPMSPKVAAAFWRNQRILVVQSLHHPPDRVRRRPNSSDRANCLFAKIGIVMLKALIESFPSAGGKKRGGWGLGSFFF